MSHTPPWHRLEKYGKLVWKFPKLSLYESLVTGTRKHPQREALVYVDVDRQSISRFTNAQFLDAVSRAAYLLKTTFKLKPGDALALNLHNTPEILIFNLASWICGLVTVPLDTKRDDLDRKVYKILETGALLLVTGGTDEESKEFEAMRKVVPNLQRFTISSEPLSPAPAGTLHQEKTLDATCLVLFTSGTTALPKGVQLSLNNILLNADGIRQWLKITEKDRFHIVLPLHHINSTTMCIATLLAGGTIVLSSRYSKSQFWEIMAKHRCTLSSIVPTICFDLLSEQSAFTRHQAQLRQVSRIQLGSAPVAPTDARKFIDMYKIPLVQGYGSTETALRVTGIPTDALGSKEYLALVDANTIGEELAWNNVKVLGPRHQPTREGEQGEICIRGPIVTKGYLNNAKVNKEAFADDWFHSGDLGYWKHQHGHRLFFLEGRLKEIIIKGGVNISPLTIEHAILKNFAEVATCYAAPCPDARYGEEIGVVVAFKEGLSEAKRSALVKKLRTAADAGTISGIAPYEHPKYLFEVSNASLPTTSTGKVQRVVIKEYLRAMLSPIAQTGMHTIRQLTPFDEKRIDEAVAVHNLRWGRELGADRETFVQAVKNGLVVGAIRTGTGKLEGVVLAERVKYKDVVSGAEYLKTYAGATGDLTLKPHTADGDALLLVSIATKGKPIAKTSATAQQYVRAVETAPKRIDVYLDAHTDPVLSFHEAAKGGLDNGAHVVRILPNARPEDREAVGYNVLMEYPTLSPNCLVRPEASLGTQLVEAVMCYAVKRHITHLFAYSRPAGLLRYLIK